MDARHTQVRRFLERVKSVWEREGLRGVISRVKFKVFKITQDVLYYASRFNPYERLEPLKKIEVEVLNKNYLLSPDSFPPFSVVVPVKNEEAHIEYFLTSLLNQSLAPHEIIFVDGGSKDNTPQMIKDFMKENSHLKVRFIDNSGGRTTPAGNRNRGFEEVSTDIVVFVDAGNRLHGDYFRNLVGVLTEHPDADLVAGVFVTEHKGKWANRFVWNWEHVDYSKLLPSGIGVLVKAQKFKEAGKFPMFLSYSGEDTLFDINYRKVSNKWVFNRAARILWVDPPLNKKQTKKRAYNYGKGDGESGYGDFYQYDKLANHLKKRKVFFQDEIDKENFKGYLAGRKDRSRILKDAGIAKGCFLILSGIPFTDSGGGQRGAQMALALMERGYRVVYVNIYPSYERGGKVYMDVNIPMLELYHIDDFDVEDFVQRHKEIFQEFGILVEIPHPKFMPIIFSVRKKLKGVKVIYDCIDNWDSELGNYWYEKGTEIKIADEADLLICSARTLKERMKSISSRDVHLIPNAVNTRIFKPGKYPKPNDLPQAENLVIYTGALWGDWFDWELVELLSQSLKDCHFVYIGNIPIQRKREIKNLKKLGNVHFIGLKDQADLPGYLSYAKCCIIPFRYDEKVIKYTNPLKIYEYLAMGKPVVSIYMDEIEGIPGVLIARNHREFIENVKRALTEKLDDREAQEFVRLNSWEMRIEQLLHLLKHH